ncbi:hypothetical protein MFLAVUS_002373 [Mucor flavus]|uniref:chitinase n=1 Tax=Mucor flavus TaxID=439312 RepID=A0ABP9YQ33_9FUNG
MQHRTQMGQNSASAAENDPANTLWQKPLSHYCDNEDADIIVVSFLHQFGQGRSTAYDLANRSRDCKGLIPGTELLDCSHMETEINYCQSKHKKIILSMGGATPAYGVGSIKEGEDLADELWNTFAGGKNSQYRPFGSASIDGFDLDIENGEKAGYAAFVHKMRKNYETDSSKTYYIAAAPQCPFPDYFVGDALNEAWFDFVMIQFYNNFCNVVNTAAFNYDEWDTWAKTRSINKNVRLFVGIPGSPSAAGRGYVPYTQLVTTIKPLQLKDTFGGIMVWDASQAYGNTQDVLPDYANGITRLIKGNNPAPAELAPVIIGLSPEGTTVARVEPSSTSIPTVFPPPPPRPHHRPPPPHSPLPPLL